MKKLKSKALIGITTLFIITVLFTGLAGASVDDVINSVHSQVCCSSSYSASAGNDVVSQANAYGSGSGIFGVSVAEAQSISVAENTMSLAYSAASGQEARSGAGVDVGSTHDIITLGGGIATGDYTAGSVTSGAGIDGSYNTAGINVESYGAVFNEDPMNFEDANTYTVSAGWS